MANGNLPEIKSVPTPEAAPEKRENREANQPTEQSRPRETVQPTAERAPAAAPSVPAAAAQPRKNADLVRVERALEENLNEVYLAMKPQVRLRFRQRGEETAARLNAMIERARINFRSVLKLIRGWLKLIPGVNRFFLEQEAKIKTDRILAIAAERRRNKPGSA